MLSLFFFPFLFQQNWQVVDFFITTFLSIINNQYVCQSIYQSLLKLVATDCFPATAFEFRSFDWGFAGAKYNNAESPPECWYKGRQQCTLRPYPQKHDGGCRRLLPGRLESADTPLFTLKGPSGRPQEVGIQRDSDMTVASSAMFCFMHSLAGIHKPFCLHSYVCRVYWRSRAFCPSPDSHCVQYICKILKLLFPHEVRCATNSI